MKKYLKKLPEEIQNLIRLSGAVASLRNMSIYLVGGFVRDLILGVKNLDMDIAVEGDAIVFAEDLSSRLKARLIRHRRFGTATVEAGHHLKLDIATARREIYPEPATLPVVTFGTLQDDLKRRDFTINAMAISINEHNFGSLIDFFNGESDVYNKKIRILHDLSFIDDPTRILRAIRFEKRYNFTIEAETLKLLKCAVKNTMLRKVQPQRLRDELILLLKENHPLHQIKRMQVLTGFDFLKQGLSLSKKTSDLLHSVQKEIAWFITDHAFRRTLDTWLIYFMALIDSLDMRESKRICQRFVFRKGDEKRILSFKKISENLISKLREKIKPSQIFRMLQPLSYEAILLIKAKYDNHVIKKHIEDFLEIYNDMRIYISGHHLQNLGITPGPLYQKIFSKVLNAKLNGLVNTEEEEIALIKKLTKNGDKIYGAIR